MSNILEIQNFVFTGKIRSGREVNGNKSLFWMYGTKISARPLSGVRL